METYFKKYIRLRDEIDTLATNLGQKHQEHIKCKMGCELCCMDYCVFPIEFHFILNELQKVKQIPELNKNADEDDCIFLTNHTCNIHEVRPVICRTHGLPLLYMGENSNWELSACELNFTEFVMEKFSEENTFPQDKFNSKLFMLNKAFIQEFKKIDYSEFDLIPIKNLKKYV